MEINKSQKSKVTFLFCILFCVAGCSQMFTQTSNSSDSSANMASASNKIVDTDSDVIASMDSETIEDNQINAPVVLSNM